MTVITNGSINEQVCAFVLEHSLVKFGQIDSLCVRKLLKVFEELMI